MDLKKDLLIEKKIDFFKEVIQRTILHVQNCKRLDILGIIDINTCIERLGELSKQLQEILTKESTTIVNELQLINDSLSIILKTYGTQQLEDLLLICFGANNETETDKMNILKKYFHPTSYKIAVKKDELTDNLTCVDIVLSSKSFHMKVYGIKLFIKSLFLKKSLVIFGFVDDVIINFLNHKYIISKKAKLEEIRPTIENQDIFNKCISSLNLTDYLILDNIYGKYAGYMNQQTTLKEKPLVQIIKEFISDGLYNKRNTLLHLLIHSSNYENQYLAYLLYDLLSNDSNGHIDTQDQTILFDSFSWEIKQFFKQAMKKTVQYTNDLSNFDIHKIPLEQQICLLNASDSVKEKAMIKLKEVKSKSEDSGTKARQYLDGLLKIPFNIYKREPILTIMDKIRVQFKNICNEKEIYTSIEILNYINNYTSTTTKNTSNTTKNTSTTSTKPVKVTKKMKTDIAEINTHLTTITNYIADTKVILNKAVYGHEKAKTQIERIIGQWINGTNKSHVLGFEGNPGIGKTTLAKGLANCLKDENGNSRPFALIALGGDSNASTLQGFGFTYTGSNWGSIVQILMDKKCMNPIILFDEVDKISKTENGKEITGVLTHLLDSTQNNTFQDKYFSGIDLDLSKALFILSYNDPGAIDSVLLDRIHRIKFDSLSLDDKIVIAKTHLLPELYSQIGLQDMIFFSDEVLKFIIEEYTLEPGIRKLKEKLFEIIGDINIEMFHKVESVQIPIQITIADVKEKYFKDKREIKIHQIHEENKVGLINALWANQMAQGGVLPIQASFVPSSKFLELTLTGSMGEVMKESISVSLTNAWNLTNIDTQRYLIEQYNDVRNNKVCGIHIHCPDISTKKDGPSATTAFTVLIYSLFNNIKIKHNFGITGETHFGFEITEIGGLQEKIIHSIKSGITEFIFPKENQSDFDKIMKKYGTNVLLNGIKFHPVKHIDEVFDLILER
jgi:ATP-dependent Lon protease